MSNFSSISISTITGILLGLTLLITAMGFRKVVYFVSVGYAFSIVAMGLAVVVVFFQQITALALLHNLLLLLWGMRLGVFLLQRDQRTSFQKTAREATGQYAGVSMPRKFAIWVGVSVLYVLMFLPGLFSAANFSLNTSIALVPVQLFGLVLMAGGLIIETLADQQKLVYKTHSPHAFCNVGLYRWVRCPNYLGEIIFWIGNWVAAAFFYVTPGHWIATLTGLILLILIMFGSTRRLERAQEKRYGDLPEYQNYVKTVPVIFPFVPVYTLKNIHLYLE
jgi:steroid 5-alpha reductase family enzyme